MRKRIALFGGALFAAGMMFAGAPVELENPGFHQTDGKGGAVEFGIKRDMKKVSMFVFTCTSAMSAERGATDSRHVTGRGLWTLRTVCLGVVADERF